MKFKNFYKTKILTEAKEIDYHNIIGHVEQLMKVINKIAIDKSLWDLELEIAIPLYYNKPLHLEALPIKKGDDVISNLLNQFDKQNLLPEIIGVCATAITAKADDSRNITLLDHFLISKALDYDYIGEILNYDKVYVKYGDETKETDSSKFNILEEYEKEIKTHIDTIKDMLRINISKEDIYDLCRNGTMLKFASEVEDEDTQDVLDLHITSYKKGEETRLFYFDGTN